MFTEREEAERTNGTYFQTDLDSGEQTDLAGGAGVGRPSDLADTSSGALPVVSHQRQDAGDDWDADQGDENTKRFFGLIPKDKPKGQTVRDVKRNEKERREREKQKEKEDEDYGEEIKLRVSNVDNEVSSIIHARISSSSVKPSQSAPPPAQVTSQPPLENGQNGHPLYENLPGYNSNSNGLSSSLNIPESLSNASSRRSSLILMAPKPFVPYQEKTPAAPTSSRPYKSEEILNSATFPTNTDSFLNSRPGVDQAELNPYVNENPYTQSNSGQFHAKPFVAHQRGGSELSNVSDQMMTPREVNDPMMTSVSKGLYSSPHGSVENNLGELANIVFFFF